MAINMAARRAAKAKRRKAVVSDKRRAEQQAGSLASQVREAAALPIQHCLLSDELFQTGMGTLYVARGASPHRLVVTSFLLDTAALGIKDVFLREFDGAHFREVLAQTADVDPKRPVEPSYARKLLRELVAWSAARGFGPHEDFTTLERIFGDVRAEDSSAEFEFGLGGRTVVIPGPSDTQATLRQYQKRLAASPVGTDATALTAPDAGPE